MTRPKRYECEYSKGKRRRKGEVEAEERIENKIKDEQEAFINEIMLCASICQTIYLSIFTCLSIYVER